MGYLETSEWRNIDMDYEEKDIVEQALALQARAHELEAHHYSGKGSEAEERGYLEAARSHYETASVRMEDAKKFRETLYKIQGGLGLRLIDFTREVEKDVSDSESGTSPDPKSAA